MKRQYSKQPGSGPTGKTCGDCNHRVRAPDSQHACMPVVDAYGWRKTKAVDPASPACEDYVWHYGPFSPSLRTKHHE